MLNSIKIDRVSVIAMLFGALIAEIKPNSISVTDSESQHSS